MKKGALIIGALFVTILLISTVTAVPTQQSKPVMDIIDRTNQQKEKFETMSDHLPQGIFDLIWQLLLSIINLIIKLIEVVNTLMSIVQLIQVFVNGLQTLIQMIQNLIDLINDLFNPEGVAI